MARAKLGWCFFEMTYPSYRSALAPLKHLFELMNDGTVAIPKFKFNTKSHNLLLKARDQSLEANKPFNLQELMSIQGVGDGAINDMLKVVTEEPEIAQNVIKYIMYYRDLFTSANELSASSTMRHYPRVLSLDFGLSECTYCLVEDKIDSYAVKKWEEMNVSLPKPYNPRMCFLKVQEGIDSLPEADVYILEKQSHRNITSGFFAISLGLRIVEAMTFGILGSRSKNVCSINPARLSNYFTIGKSSGRTKSKKRNAIHLVQQMLMEGKTSPLGVTVTVAEQQFDHFHSLKKKDDLSDSLLQAIAFLDWNHMSKSVHN